VNRITLTTGLALMDTCWLYPWAFLLGVWAEPGRGAALLPATVILALLLVAALATHGLGRLARRNPRGARLVLASLAVLAATLAVRLEHYPAANGLDWLPPLVGALAAAIGQITPPVLGFALALYVWWRGVRLGSQTPGYADVESSFRWGIGRLAVFGLIIAVTSRPTSLPTMEGTTTPYVVGFFFVSLLTLALGRLESLRTRYRRPNLNTQWLAVLVVVAGSVVLLALLLGQLVSFDVMLSATRPLFDLLGTILLLLIYAIVIPLAWVIEWVIYLLLSLLQAGKNRPPPPPPAPTDVDNILQRFFAEALPPEVQVVLKAAGAVLLLGVALIIVARGLGRWRPSAADADATNEERESLWNAQVMRALLLAWLRRLLRRNKRDGAAPVGLDAEAAVAAPTPELVTVRQMYADLLRRGEAAGATRAVSTTPLEHVPALTDTLEPEEPIGGLTAAYLRVRYAEMDVDESEAATLAAELEGVHAKGAVE
jgi:Domain of unknown function (DUF4129)